MLSRFIGLDKIFLLVGTLVGISIYFELLRGSWITMLGTMFLLMFGVYITYQNSERPSTYRKIEDLFAGVLNSLAIIAILQAF